MRISVVFPEALLRLPEAMDPEEVRLEWMRDYGPSILSIGQAAKNQARQAYGVDLVDDLIGFYVENHRAVEYACVPILVSRDTRSRLPTARWHDIDNKVALILAEMGLEADFDPALRECLCQYYLLKGIHLDEVRAITYNPNVVAVIAAHPTVGGMI